METPPALTQESETADCLLFELDDDEPRDPQQRFWEFRQSIVHDHANQLLTAFKRDFCNRPELWKIYEPALEEGWRRMVDAATWQNWEAALRSISDLMKEAYQRYHTQMKAAEMAVRGLRYGQDHPYFERLHRMTIAPVAYLREVLSGSER